MITIYIGKSAAGKDAYYKRQIAMGVEPIVSYTTRPMRDGEKQGVDYNFVSVKRFKELIEKNMLAEYRKYDTKVNGVPDTWYYGTPKIPDPSKNYVHVVTIEGVEALIDGFGPENMEIVYVEADDNIRKERAKRRDSKFDETEWNRRLAADAIDFSEEKLINLAAKLRKPITVMYNNGSELGKVTFSKINPPISS